DWYTLQEVKKILGIDDDVILRWINSKKLNANHYDGKKNIWQITKKNLKKFIRTYPCEIPSRNLDFPEIVEILCGLIYKVED
ncbi:MAG: helix-turn-helix domain-containing protein, partial [Lutibacter sp.]